ncbi:protein tyrosine phosphatase [Caldimicrobium thiodismutans]|uniref:Protein tyrosine phosphatase n=1 Tax=Caldimicrobium thiodismutans TaxID=1653476 RepID=A0A0U5AHG5_9BACT|nr:arsenate reductase ArsC [Caldimicrobium thiodismutans]BAU23340.1 protein tyrosine phosphatase [Caldimicrobium thiodismutans]
MKIAFICKGNSARSQMAEVYAKHFARLYKKEVEVFSAGADPEKEINPFVLEVMKEEGFDLSENRPKGLEEIPLKELDLIITLCDQAEETCPFIPGVKKIHMPFPDPAKLEGKEVLSEVRKIRDLIKQKVEDLIKTL